MSNAESGYNNYFALPVAPADTTITLGTAPTTTSGRVYVKNEDQEEWIDYTGVSGATITGCTRSMSQTADPSTGGTGLTWVAGTPVVLVWMHDQLPMKTKSNTYTAGTTQTFPDIDFTGTTTQGLKVKSLTTAQRTALTPSNGAIVYDSTLAVLYQYIGGVRTQFATAGATPASTTTSLGGTEISTQTETEQQALTGSVGPLGPTNATINPANITSATPAYDDRDSFSDTSNSNYLQANTYETIAQNAINTRGFTAGENVTAGDLLYMDADTSVYKTVRKASTVAQVGSVTGLDTVTSTNSMIGSAQLTTDKSILIYKKSADSLIYGTVVSFSRGTPTFGTEQVIAGAALQADSGGTVCVLSSSLFVVSYKRNSDNFAYSVACTVSGTTITAGTATLMYNTNTLENLTNVASCKVSAISFAIVVHDATLDDPIAVAATISGTTITAGSAVAIEAVTMNAAGSPICCYVQDGVIGVAYDDGTNIKCNMATISGTTITAKTAFTTSIAGYCTAVDQILYIDYGRFLIFQNGLTTGEIRVISINVPNQSVWTTGIVMSNYFVSNDNILYYAQAIYLGDNKVVICNQMLNGGDLRLRIMKLGYNDLEPIYDTTVAGTVGDVSLSKLTSNQDKVLIIYQDTGTTNLNYSLYWNTENQFIGVCKTTTSAAGTVPTATRGLAAISGLTAGQPYYVGDAGAAATSGTKQIGVATSTATLHIR